MKKSIGVIAAILLSASAYSQPYSGPGSGRGDSDHGLTGNPEGDSQRSRQFESGSPTTGNVDARVTPKIDSKSKAESNSSNRSIATSTSSSNDQQSGADSSLSRSNSDISQSPGVLDKADDYDLANRNQAHRDDFSTDFSNRKGSEADPDMIFEEWLIIPHVDVDEAVGAPGESETGNGSSRSLDSSGANGEFDNQNPQPNFNADVQESGELNESRIYNGSDYFRDNSGAPAGSDSGSAALSDDCDRQKNKHVGGPAASESETVRGSGSARDHDDRVQFEHPRDYYQSDSNASEGAPAGNEIRGGKSSDGSHSERLQHGDRRDYPESSKITPDL